MPSCERDSGPLVSYWSHDDANAEPFTLPPLLEPRGNAAGATACRGEQYPIVVEADHDAIVENNAGLAEHNAVADAPGLECHEIVDIEAIREVQRVGPDQLDLSQR